MHNKTNRKTCRLGRRPEKQGPRLQSGNQGWIDKLATGINGEGNTKLRVTKSEITVGTWNVRSLWETGKLELLKEEMKRYRYDILGLAEVRWTGAGELNGGEMIWSGEEKDHVRGVGFLLSQRAKAALLGYKPFNSRMMVARFSGQPLNLSVIQIYAPTADKKEEEIEQFYQDLEQLLEDIPNKDIKIITGDWNAKVGMDNTGWERVMMKYGYGEMNDRGERLLEFALKHDLLIANTKFQQKDCRKWTWKSPDGKTKNMIDLILIERRWLTSVKLCRTYQGADIMSDHSLVLCNIRLRLKRIPKRIPTKKRNLEALREPETANMYKAEVDANLTTEGIRDLSSVETKAERLKWIIEHAVHKTVPLKEVAKRQWISEETLTLAKKKRQLKLQMKDSVEITARYKALCNEVRKSARKDKQKWLEGKCQEIEDNTGEHRTREVYKLIKTITRRWQPRQAAIKDKSGKILMDKKQVKRRWTDYCEELYKEKDVRNAELLQELQAITPMERNDEKEDILYEEVERAIKRLKNNKSPGVDEITGEMIKAGGEELAKEIHGMCNDIWKGEKTPVEWIKSILITMPKSGDLKECKNYRTIALMSHVGKILMMILMERLKAQTEDYLSDEQGGFRRDRNTIQQILMLRLMAEKARRKGKLVYNCFVDFEKAFDSINKEVTWAVLRSYGVGRRLVEILKDIGERTEMAVRIGHELGSWFRMETGTKQGDPVSPIIFITYLERVMDRNQNKETGFSVQGHKINNLRFADDIDLIEEERDELQESVKILNEEGRRAGLRINLRKTKTMVFGSKEMKNTITIDGQLIENVESFVYLGSLITWDNNCSKDIRARIAKGKGVMANFNTIWKNTEISYNTKLTILKTCVFSTMLYGCETWTYRKADANRILAFEMYCYRRILRLSWMKKVTNVEVRRRLMIDETLMHVIMKRKLALFGHICRMEDNRKIKNVMFGMLDGSGKRGRPAREWLDDIKEWCGMEIHVLFRRAQDREGWRHLIGHALSTYGHCAHG